MKKDTNKIRVTEIQRFCMKDGPGVRTVIFLKGCPLRCAWCHNPETQPKERELLYAAAKCIGCGQCVSVCPQNVHVLTDDHRLNRESCDVCENCAMACPTGALTISGTDFTPEALFSEIKKDLAFYGKRGGVTLSGGEPFTAEHAMIDLLKLCKEQGISTAIETCGYGKSALFEEAVPVTDLFLWDIKDTCEERHRAYTGVSNIPILSHLKRIDQLGGRTRLRCILVNGVNTDLDHYVRVAELAASLLHCEGVEWLPYHAYGGSKSTLLGRPDNAHIEWIPSHDQIKEAKEILRKNGISSI